MRLGVLDAGSNTVHLLVVDAHHGGAPYLPISHKTELKLSEHLTDDGQINSDCDRFVVRVRQRVPLDVAEDVGVTEIMAFATSAIRRQPTVRRMIAEVEQLA